MRRAALLASLVALLACEQSRPFVTTDPEPPPPITGPFPRQLTYDLEGEWNPTLTPDGATLLYSFAEQGRTDRDRCLGFGPAVGGWRTQQLCWRSGNEAESTDVVVEGAASVGGRLAFVAERGSVTSSVPNARALLLGTMDRPDTSRVIMTFPRIGSAGLQWHGARDLTWIGDSMLVFVALIYQYRGTASGSPADTFTTGVDIVSLDVRTAVPVVRIYAGTRYASSVANGPFPGTVMYTMGGDSRVWTLDLASGARTPLRDFAALGIVRDARVSGNTMVFLAGGKVDYFPSVPLGIDQQIDSGGYVYTALVGDTMPPLRLTPDSLRFYLRLHVSAAGGRAVAEGFRVRLLQDPNTGLVDTSYVSASANIFLLQVP